MNVYNINKKGEMIMLIEFSVKNFMSFKDKATFSMEKSNVKENIDNTFKFKDIELLKTTAIYGANASGKTNLIKALTCAILMIRNSDKISLNEKWNFPKAFLLDNDSRKKPCEFEFVFIANKIKYKYSFSADTDKIHNESLIAYYTRKPTTIFSRKNTNEYNFYAPDKSKLESIKNQNTENKLFLPTASAWNYDKTKDAFLWFVNCIDTYDSSSIITDKNLESYSNNEKDLKEFAIKLLKEADIIIKDIEANYKDVEMDNNLLEMLVPPIIKTSDSFKTKKINIQITHEVRLENNKTSKYNLNFSDESSGTQILFALAPFLKQCFETTKVMVIDELEKSLHPVLVRYLINLFHNKEINKANSQLIFTTHLTNLLDLNLFRRDQIWFTEKNPDNGISELYPLDSFLVRKEENIEKGYINGRYGAIPFIK